MAEEKLLVRIGADVAGLKAGLATARKEVDGFKSRILKMSLGLAGTFGPSIFMGVNFQKNMKFVGAIMEATTNEFKQLTNIAREMGATTEFTASQAAEGLKFLGMAGLDATQSIEALPQMLNLATAGAMDLGRAADIATNILNQFGLEVKELTRVADVLAKVQSSSNTNIEQAAEAFVYAGTMANMFGMQIEEVAAVIGLLANQGIKASLAGTTLRQSMIKMLNPSSEAVEIMEKYNIILHKSDGSLRNYTDVILDMIDAQISLQDSSALLGARAGQLAALFKGNSDGFIAYIDKMNNADGAALRLADSIRKTLWGSFKELWSSMESVGLSVFNTYGAKLKEMIDNIVGIVREVDNWAKANEGLLTDKMDEKFNQMITAIKTVKTTLESVASFIGNHPQMSEFGLIGWAFGGRKGLLIGTLMGAIIDDLKSRLDSTWQEANIRKIIALNDDIIRAQTKLAEIQANRAKFGGEPLNVEIIKIKEVNDLVRERSLLEETLTKKYRDREIVDFDKEWASHGESMANDMMIVEKKFQRDTDKMKHLTDAERERVIGKAKKDADKIAEINSKALQKNREIEEEIQKFINDQKFKEDEAYLKLKDDMIEDHSKKARELAIEESKMLLKIEEDRHDKILKVEQEAQQERKRVIQDVSDSMSKSFGDAFGSIIAGTKNVKEAFSDMASSIISDIVRIMVQENITTPLAKSFFKAFSGMFNSGGTSAYGGGANVDTLTSSQMSQPYAYSHRGGIVGRPGGETRMFNPSIFANAPRLHSGLARDEFPTILQRGEEVISKGGSSPRIQFNVINQTGADAQATQQGEPQFDGKKWVWNIILEGLRTSQSNRMAIRNV